MKTAQGKISLLAFCLLLIGLLVLPMRAGQEDSLIIKPGALKMSVGSEYKITCALSSDEPGQSLRFESKDNRVASIGNDGTVYGLSSGETIITAKASGGAEASMRVIVDGVPMRELTLNTDELYIEKGQISSLRATYNSDASDARLQWVSANEKVARVDAAGRIEGVGGGETYVSVVAPSGLSASAKVFVNVDGTAVHISPNGLTLGVGAKVPLKVSYLPLDSTDRVKMWSSDNPSVLAVEDGVLHAKSRGDAYISVMTEDGLTTGMKVTVEAAPMNLQLDPARATLERGDTMDLQLGFLEQDGNARHDSTHLVVWESEDESVATVDQNGRVTALKSGSTEITATCDGMTATCRLNVEVNIREIRLDQQEIYLLREETGNPIQLSWVIDPLDADDPTVVFASNNEQVARVSKDGLVTLTGGYGTAIITAYSESGASAEFIVNVVTALPTAEPVYEEEIYDDVYPYAEEDTYGDTYPYTEEDIYGDTYPYTEEDIYGDTYPYTEEDLAGEYPYVDEGIAGEEMIITTVG